MFHSDIRAGIDNRYGSCVFESLKMAVNISLLNDVISLLFNKTIIIKNCMENKSVGNSLEH